MVLARTRTLIHGFLELTDRRSFKSHSIVFLDITWITTCANRCPECERFYPLHSISHSLCILVSYPFIPLSSGKRVAFDNCCWWNAAFLSLYLADGKINNYYPWFNASILWQNKSSSYNNKINVKYIVLNMFANVLYFNQITEQQKRIWSKILNAKTMSFLKYKYFIRLLSDIKI